MCVSICTKPDCSTFLKALSLKIHFNSFNLLSVIIVSRFIFNLLLANEVSAISASDTRQVRSRRELLKTNFKIAFTKRQPSPRGERKYSLCRYSSFEISRLIFHSRCNSERRDYKWNCNRWSTYPQRCVPFYHSVKELLPWQQVRILKARVSRFKAIINKGSLHDQGPSQHSKITLYLR